MSRALLLALSVFSLFSGCGRYFSAEVAGYVKDSESERGIDGAVIRIYIEEPADAEADGFIVETASVTSGGNPGYYNHTIIWQNALPAFGAEGDTSSVWLGITHRDYIPAVRVVRGILSGTLNFVPDVTLDRSEFSVPSVTGVVVGPSGDGLNGVRIVLDLASTEEEEDYVTVTTTIDGEEGRYRFAEVSWRDDEAAGSGSDTEECTIFVDDNEYVSDDVLTVLLSSDQEIEVTEIIRAASDEFTVPRVSGSVVDAAGEPLNGVRVVLDLASTTGEEEDSDYVAVTRTIDGEAGIYEFTNVTWIDEEALGSLTDTEAANIRVDDTDYESAQLISVTLTSGQEQEVATRFHVTRTNAVAFETRVTGRCLSRTGTAPDTVDLLQRGIEVTCTYTDDDGLHTLYAQTDANGTYSFLIRWNDADPRDFDDGNEDLTIPSGEDGIIVEIIFAAPFDALSFTVASGRERLVKSWLDPNYVPDAVVTP